MDKVRSLCTMMIQGSFFPNKSNLNNITWFIFKRVLYFSLHRYDYGRFWPNLRESDFDFIGEKEGKGYNINIPLNEVCFIRLVFSFSS